MEKEKNALERFESIISDFVPNFFNEGFILDEEIFEGFKDSIQREVEHIKSRITTTIMDLDRQRDIKKYIQFHEQEIIRLSGLLINYVHPREINTLSKKLNKVLLFQQ